MTSIGADCTVCPKSMHSPRMNMEVWGGASNEKVATVLKGGVPLTGKLHVSDCSRAVREVAFTILSAQAKDTGGSCSPGAVFIVNNNGRLVSAYAKTSMTGSVCSHSSCTTAVSTVTG
jgi:hypothetical protein